MKAITPMKSYCSLLLFCIAFIGFSQLHQPPQCGENFTLDWTESPVESNEYDWSPDGAITNIFTDVHGSGVDFTVSFTGDTNSLGSWGGMLLQRLVLQLQLELTW